MQQFQQATGRSVYRTGSKNPVGTGWCTWFVHAVSPFPLPRGDARTYYRQMRQHVLPYPVPGSVVVWGGGVGRGHGHVGYVTAVGVEPGTFDVWDSNFSTNWDKKIRWRRHRTNDSDILGFICPEPYREAPPEWLPRLPADYDLAFVREGDLHLYRFRDGDERMVTAQGGVSHPSWSADGESVVFARDGNVFRYDLERGSLKQLTTSGVCWQPAVHPERDVVWLVRLLPDQNGLSKRADLWRVGLDGDDPRRLGMITKLDATRRPLPVDQARAVWKPDGSAVAMRVTNAETIYLDGAGRPIEPPVGGPAVSRWDPVPAWQPNTSLLAIVRRAADTARVGVELIDAALGRAVDALPGPGPLVAWPAFSPQGDDLVVAAQPEDETGTHLVNYRLGRHVVERVLTGGEQPAWSPASGGSVGPRFRRQNKRLVPASG